MRALSELPTSSIALPECSAGLKAGVRSRLSPHSAAPTQAHRVLTISGSTQKELSQICSEQNETVKKLDKPERIGYQFIRNALEWLHSLLCP